MATLNIAYASPAAITATLTSLADGAYRQSAAVDNSVNLYVDALVGGSVQTGTSPTANTTIRVYAYGQRSDDGDYTAGASGSDAAYTADGEEGLLKLLEIIVVDATSNQDYEWGPVSVAQAFGGILPRKWGLVVLNSTGAALNATGTNNEQKYVGIEYDSA
jgi:hypothetical protein